MLQRLMIFDEHGNPPVNVRSPVADPQRRQRQAGPMRPRQPDEIRCIIFRRRHRRGPVVGEEILAKP
jgi:hypothetical protein